MSQEYAQLFRDACDYVDAFMPPVHLDARDIESDGPPPPCTGLRRTTDAEIHARFDRIIEMLDEPMKRASLNLK